ncbi:MAG: response regulator [Candidatus Heimdallarchaeota archaeon]|nr:response regulator [Candidatus Heimdallarchaeota archaeon]
MIDDDEEQLMILNLYLKKHKYNVETASNGALGIDTFSKKQNEIGLIITDFHMEKMTGEEVINAIHKIDPNIPILLLTGDKKVNLEDKNNLRQIVNKPLNFFTFKKIVNHYFEGN